MDSKSQQAIGVDGNDTKNQTLADLTSVLKSIEEKIKQELLVEIHKKTDELELLRVKYREIVLENPLIKDKLTVCQRECDELREQVKRLGQDKKEELDLLDKKYGEIVLENLLTRDKLKTCERECDELKEQVVRLGEDLTMSCDRERRAKERYMKLMENVKKQEGSEREKLVELQRRNGDLECGKRKAEAEVQLWKTKFEKLDFRHSLLLEGKAVVENVGSNKGVEEKRLGQTKECKNEKNSGSSIATLDRCVSNFREKRIRSAAGTFTLDMAEKMGEKGLRKTKECHKKIVGDGIATLVNRQTQNNVSNFHEKIIGLGDGSSALDKTKEIGDKGLGKTKEHHIQANVEKVIETIDNQRTQNNVSNSHKKTIGLAGGSSTLDKTKETGEKGSGRSKECHNEKNVGSNATLDNRKTQNNISNCDINIRAMAGQSPPLDKTKEMRGDKTKEMRDLDMGCGVASFGGYLLAEDILTLSFAPRDSHKSQIQFALERGIPAFVAMLGTRRLPFPAFSFDLMHCSRCLIPFTAYNATYFIEVDRLLRPGGYLVISGPPVQWPKQDKEWADLQAVARALCYELIAVDGNTVIWKKPSGDSCLPNQNEFGIELCDESDDSSYAWYFKLKKCVSRISSVKGEQAVGVIPKWPERLTKSPSRATLMKNGIDVFDADTRRWARRVAYYKKSLNLKLGTPAIRNVMDMNAFFGGFGAALLSDPVWVMNVVPARMLSTLGVIYDRGLIGVYHDWCEPFSTYPRTYDLIHVVGIESLIKDFGSRKNRCNLVDLMVEMDRILRPEGTVVIRDTPEILEKVNRISHAVRWTTTLHENEPETHGREMILTATKNFWKLPSSASH